MVLRFLLLILVAVVLPLHARPDTPDAIAREILAPLLDPAKVATLKGDRPANPRLYKVLYWLETATRLGGEPGEVIETAQRVTGNDGTVAATADKTAILRNRRTLDSLGCFTVEGMMKLRKGGSPTITRGEQAGMAIALDHVLPRSVVPELATRFFNLEAISAYENRIKSNRISPRELGLARRWYRVGLLSTEGLKAVERAGRNAGAEIQLVQ